MALIPAEVPDAGTPIINAGGFIDPVWHNFFFTLLRRTGGTAGLVPVTSVTGTLPIVATAGTEPVISINLATETTDGAMAATDKLKLDGVGAGATVVSVSGVAPIGSTGGPTPAISITNATTLADGSMSAADKAKLDGITPGAGVASVSGTAPIVSSGGTAPAISINAATTVAAGSMSAADKVKLNGIGTGATVTGVTGSAPIVSSGGAAPAISITNATTIADGAMSAADKAKLDLITYATGTWTPVLSFDTPGNLAITYSAQSGSYTRIGRRVRLEFAIATSAFTWTTSSGFIRITGLPITPNASFPEWGGVLSWAGVQIVGFMAVTPQIFTAAPTVIRLTASGNNVARANLSTGNMAPGSTVALIGNIEYYV